jgi:4-hydroxy-tetrahydrodipicolinate synthase
VRDELQPEVTRQRKPGFEEICMPPFHGLSAFPITPTDAHGIVDTAAVERLVSRLATAGVDSIGLLGSTGGYAYLNRAERQRAIQAAVATVGGKVPVMVGIGALRTDDAQQFARDAADAGADALLLAPMSYTPLTQEEVFQHYVAVTGATDLPLCVYNNPGTTHFTFTRELLARLAELPNIAAIKMPLPGAMTIKAELDELRSGPVGRLAIGYSGDWGAAEAFLSGADAFYSVLGGVLPDVAVAMRRAAAGGDRPEVERIDALLQPMWGLFREFGSIRVVYVMVRELGLSDAVPARPILPLSSEAQGRVVTVLSALREEMRT